MTIRTLTILILSLTLFACEKQEKSAEIAITSNTEILGRGEGKDNWWDALPRAAWSGYELVEVVEDQGWFEVYKITDSIYGIYEMGQFEEVISYLILGEERALLFDTGLGVGDMASLVAGLTDLPVSVLNSHSHYDHIGGNYQFERIYGVASDFTVGNAAGHANSEVKEFVGPGWVWKPMPNGVSYENYHTEPFEISDIISDRDTIDLGGRVLSVYLVPGHAPDALVLIDKAARLMWTGDTFYPATLYAHLEGSDVEDYTKSAERLSIISSDVDFLLPSHNEPWVPADYLGAMHRAFLAMQRPGADYRISDGDREYSFDGFTIMVSDPPPWLD